MKNPLKQPSEIKEAIDKYSIVYVMREQIEHRGGVIRVKASDSTRKALGQKPCVVIGLHPNRYEAAPILAGLPSRKDFFFLGNSFYNRFTEVLGDQFIPLSVRRETHSLRALANGLLGFSHNHGSRSEPLNKNVQSITEAARRVSEGGIGLIFPDNLHSPNSRWKTGVGHLVKQVDHLDTCIVFAHATGKVHPTRLLPIINIPAPYQAIVHYSEPIKLSSIPTIEDQGGRTLTKFFEERYDDWVSQE